MKRHIILSVLSLLCLLPPVFPASDSLSLFVSLSEEEQTPDPEERLAIIRQAMAYCQAQKDAYHEIFFKNREITSLFSLAIYDLDDPTNEILLQTEEGLARCPERDKESWQRLHIDAMANRCIYGIMANDYTLCSELLRKMNLSYTDPYAQGKQHLCRGIMAAHKNDYEEAFSHFRQSAAFFGEAGDTENVFKATANMGLVMLSTQKYQDALSYFNRCHQIAIEQAWKGEKLVLSFHYMAQGYSALAQHEIAERFYTEAIRLAKEQNLKRILCFSQFNYAADLFQAQKYREAEKEANTALQYFEENELTQMEAESLRLLAGIAKEQENDKLAFVYLDRYIALIRDFWQEEQAKNFKKMESSLEDYRLQQKIQEIELTKAQVRYRNLWIGVLVFLIIASVTGLGILSRRFFRFKKRNRNTLKILEENKRNDQERLRNLENHLNAQIGSKNQTLLSNSLLFLRISNIATNIQENLQTLKKSGNLQAKDKILLYETENLVKEMDMNQNWEEFELYFQQTAGDFFSRLSQKYPALSPYEKRICALFSLNLNNKEIAMLMDRSLQSISMAKTRIKRKMNVDSDAAFSDCLKQV